MKEEEELKKISDPKSIDSIKKERRLLRNFKNQYAKNQDINDVEDWSDYLRWCDSQGFDADEIGYDDLIIQYVQFRLENKKQYKYIKKNK
tara:strand:+ start:328 stop:597 length:270 start_codon:yes stop_codon:yes gene_type:complete